MKKLTLLGLLAFTITTSNQLFANEQAHSEKINIPVIENARVFSSFTDGYPAMVNFFTDLSFTEIEQFYATQYGSPIDQQMRYGRLELYFDNSEHRIRVIVSEQSPKREVGVFIEQQRD
ncbi:hypothetical protein [Thalassotalea aquiviva]|uniref:hypothetical protein n=1 Tax=Thalassotalea aquiviva TaxID=3242415 RepID=UPI00352B5D3F